MEALGRTFLVLLYRQVLINIIGMLPCAEQRGLEFEQALRISMRNFRHIFRADRKGVQESSSCGVGVVRIIHGEEHSIGAYDLQGAKEWGKRETSARGDVEVFVKILDNPAFEVHGARGQESVGASNVVRQRFPQVPDNDFQFRETVEQAGNDQAQTVHPGLRVPPPTGGGKDKSQIAGQSSVIRFPHIVGRRRRVQVDRNVQRLCRFKEGRKAKMVEKLAAARSVHQRALESQLPDAAFKFQSRLLRFL